MTKTKLQDKNFPYASISSLKRKITRWYNKCKKQEKPLTTSGLALDLGVCKKTLQNWAGKNGEEGIPKQLSKKQKRELKKVMKEAYLMVENYAEERLFSSKYVSGAIFNLKANFGYSDKGEQDTSPDPLGKLVIEVVGKSDDSLVKKKADS